MSYDQIISSLVGKILTPFANKSVEPITSKFVEKAVDKIEISFEELGNQDNKGYYN